jgi:hypothetical protein
MVASAPTSKGMCEFCKNEVAKNKMTQHLKFCKQRLAGIASDEEKTERPKERLFHILAEGQYSPEYWLHFEIPADAPLYLIDSFLKDMWIEDLDHLSGFKINDTNYSNDYPDEFFFFSGEEASEEVEEEKELSEEEIAAEVKKFIDETIEHYMEIVTSSRHAFLGEDPFPAEWIENIRQPRTIDELVDFLKEEAPRLRKEERQVMNSVREVPVEEERKAYFKVNYQRLLAETILDELEDRSMDVLLKRVLKVGQKFSYIYDYGSSTYVSLRVLAEREGVVLDEKDAVKLLARNMAPSFVCNVCGKPATRVAMGYFVGNLKERAYCEGCGEENEGDFGQLDIINSPRVGVL